MTKSQNEPTGKKPTFLAYHVKDNGDRDPYWTRIGAAWKHADGDGYSVQLDAVPLTGRIMLRISSAKID